MDKSEKLLADEFIKELRIGKYFKNRKSKEERKNNSTKLKQIFILQHHKQNIKKRKGDRKIVKLQVWRDLKD